MKYLKDVRVTRDPWDFWVPSGYYSLFIELVEEMMWNPDYSPEDAAADFNDGYAEAYEDA